MANIELKYRKIGMKNYKQSERDHYNSRYTKNGPMESEKSKSSDIVNENSIKYFYKIITEAQLEMDQGRILDYGCGAGEKSVKALHNKWNLNGIDISEKSIAYAKEKYGSLPNVSFDVMDCEHTIFPDNTFDIVFNFGTFSSINIDKAIPEIIRILKPDGFLICIETLGHNPIFNFKRKLSVKRGKRTKWASAHIMKMNDWQQIQKRFTHSKIRHFNILSILFAPVMQVLPSKISSQMLDLIWSVDNQLITRWGLSRYAFKTVAYFQGLKFNA